MIETIWEFLESLNLGHYTIGSLVVAVLIFIWLRADIQKRRQWDEDRGERMARLKEEAIAKLRKEKDGER